MCVCMYVFKILSRIEQKLKKKLLTFIGVLSFCRHFTCILSFYLHSDFVRQVSYCANWFLFTLSFSLPPFIHPLSLLLLFFLSACKEQRQYVKPQSYKDKYDIKTILEFIKMQEKRKTTCEIIEQSTLLLHSKDICLVTEKGDANVIIFSIGPCILQISVTRVFLACLLCLVLFLLS